MADVQCRCGHMRGEHVEAVNLMDKLEPRFCIAEMCECEQFRPAATAHHEGGPPPPKEYVNEEHRDAGFDRPTQED